MQNHRFQHLMETPQVFPGGPEPQLTPAGQALSMPLMVGLARAIYNARPGELAGTLRDPAELCSPALADRTAVESLLFDAFIPAAYRHDTERRWKALPEVPSTL